MNAAVGLTAGLGLDGDRCIRVIPRHYFRMMSERDKFKFSTICKYFSHTVSHNIAKVVFQRPSILNFQHKCVAFALKVLLWWNGLCDDDEACFDIIVGDVIGTFGVQATVLSQGLKENGQVLCNVLIHWSYIFLLFDISLIKKPRMGPADL